MRWSGCSTVNQTDPSMPIEIKLPSLGDQIESGDVLEVKVREGDVIKKDQGIVELETDKATVEVPSTHAGKVLKIHVKDGQTVKTGAPLITLEETAAPAAAAPAPPTKPASAPTSTPQPKPAPAPAKPAATAAASPPPKAPESVAGPQAAPAAKSAPAAKPSPISPAPTSDSASTHTTASESDSPAADGFVAAGPAVRRFAREVGVDLARVTGSGTGGRITRDDILTVVRQANEDARNRGPASTSSAPLAEVSDMDQWGPVRFEKMTKIRKTIAAKMSESWSTAPRVTNFDDADVTELERIRQSSKNDYAANGIKLTSLPFVTKAVAMSLKKHPTINASLDVENERIVYKNYVNIGIAVDTDRGLVVPVLRDADRLSISEIARQLAAIAEKVRDGSFSLEDLRGSSFTISNLGAIGGTYSTPIINVPEVAILLLGRSRQMPVIVNDQVAVRLMMPLSLAYDHRLVDGATAARFLNDVIGFLEAPSRLLLAP